MAVRSRQQAVLGQMGAQGGGLYADPNPAPDQYQPGPVMTDPAGDATKPGPISTDPAGGDIAKPGPQIPFPGPPDQAQPGPTITDPAGGDLYKPGPVLPGPIPAGGDVARPGTLTYSQANEGLQQAPSLGGVEAPTLAGPPAGGPVEVGGYTGGQTMAPQPTNNRPVLLGFDADKLLDPSSGSVAGSKYTDAAKTFYKGLQENVGVSRGGLNNMAAFAQQNGFPNAKVIGDDKIDFGDGNGPVDVIRGDGQIVFQNTTGNPVWEQQYAKGGAAPSGGGSPTPAPIAPGPAAGGDIAGGTPAQTNTTVAGQQANTSGVEEMGNGLVRFPDGQVLPKNHPAYQAKLDALNKSAAAATGAPGVATDPKTALQQRILEMLNTDTANVSPTDANLLPQVNASRLAAQRAEERARGMAAERRHAGGFGTSGALDSDIERLAQARGEAEASNEAGIVGNELQDRRNRVLQAMNMEAGIEGQDKGIASQEGMQDKDIALRGRLADLDAAIRREQLQQQGQLGNRGMDLQDSQFWAQLGQNGQQFNDTMGFNIGQQNANNYYRWLMAGLGG